MSVAAEDAATERGVSEYDDSSSSSAHSSGAQSCHAISEDSYELMVGRAFKEWRMTRVCRHCGGQQQAVRIAQCCCEESMVAQHTTTRRMGLAVWYGQWAVVNEQWTCQAWGVAVQCRLSTV